MRTRRAATVGVGVLALAVVAAPAIAASVTTAPQSPDESAVPVVASASHTDVATEPTADDEPAGTTPSTTPDEGAEGPDETATTPDDGTDAPAEPVADDDATDPETEDTGNTDESDDTDESEDPAPDEHGDGVEDWQDNFFGDWDPDDESVLADTTPPVLAWVATTSPLTYGAADVRWSVTDDLADGETITFVQVDDERARAWGADRAHLAELPDGEHTVTVLAVDQSGNWAQPLTFAWTQLAAPVAAPKVTLTATSVTGSSASFTWSVDSPDATVWYALDDAAPRRAPSTTIDLVGLADGPHVLRVHAGVHHTDAIGSVYVDGTTATSTWFTGEGEWPDGWAPADPFGASWRG